MSFGDLSVEAELNIRFELQIIFHGQFIRFLN